MRKLSFQAGSSARGDILSPRDHECRAPARYVFSVKADPVRGQIWVERATKGVCRAVRYGMCSL